MNTAPAPCGPTPSERQMRWHQLEFYGFLHFTTNTFTDLEWGFGDESPEIFNPSEFDAEQIVTVAKDVGMKGLILTCKHHDGFCLWPSKYTEHSVKSSPWKDGQGDVVREIADECRKQGLLFGVYLSPWDRNHPDYGTPEYVDYYRKQLRELLTEYGDIFEVWHDGANGGDGYYGGANETRTIDKETYYGWPETWQLVRDLQPMAVIFSDVGPDIRWCGNERGEGSETCWMTLNTDDWCPGKADHQELGPGHEDGDKWLPPEVDVSIRPGWFYHQREDRTVHSITRLLDIFYQSIGRSGSWLLNLPPDRRGRIHEIDVDRLQQLKEILDATFKDDLAQGATVTAESVRSGFPAANVLTPDRDEYWAAENNVTKTFLELDLGRETTFNRVLIQEYIELGQRVKRWSFEVCQGGRWQIIDEQTTIGYKRILRLPDTTARRVRVGVIEARACPVICTVGLYREPVHATEPSIRRNREGNVEICTRQKVVVRYTTDGTVPDDESSIFDKLIPLPQGGELRVAVLAADNPEVLVPGGRLDVCKRYGMASDAWTIHDAGQSPVGVLEEDLGSWWQTQEQYDYPHRVVIDLHDEIQIAAVTYLPLQHSNWTTGIVSHCRIYVGNDPDDLGEPVVEKKFDNILNNPIEQLIELPEPRTGRYLCFEALAAADGGRVAIAQEIGIIPLKQ